MRYVECNWWDAHSSVEWSKDDLSPVKCTTRGWLIKEHTDYYVIAATMQNEGEAECWGEVIAIPAGCVISLEKFSG